MIVTVCRKIRDLLVEQNNFKKKLTEKFQLNLSIFSSFYHFRLDSFC